LFFLVANRSKRSAIPEKCDRTSWVDSTHSAGNRRESCWHGGSVSGLDRPNPGTGPELRSGKCSRPAL